MKIKEEVTITFKVSEVKKIIENHLKESGYDTTDVYFNINGHNDPNDWRSEYPLDYRLDEIRCKVVKR